MSGLSLIKVADGIDLAVSSRVVETVVTSSTPVIQTQARRTTKGTLHTDGNQLACSWTYINNAVTASVPGASQSIVDALKNFAELFEQQVNQQPQEGAAEELALMVGLVP